MRLYKYIEFKYALTTIRDKQVKLSEINRTNDPWELNYVDRSNPRLDEAVQKVQLIQSKEHCILCLSRVWDNPVMWAHYAKNHQGACLGFDIEDRLVDEGKLKSITYRDDLVSIPLEFPIGLDVVDAMNFSKHTHWSYEQEVRAVTTREDAIKDKYFVDIGGHLQLSEVIIGMNCSIPLKNLLRLLRKNYADVSIFKTTCSKSAYRMDRYRINHDGFAI